MSVSQQAGGRIHKMNISVTCLNTKNVLILVFFIEINRLCFVVIHFLKVLKMLFLFSVIQV